MKKNLIYILSSAVLLLLHSCGLEEINVSEPGTSNGSTIEFVARPTYYDEFNVATKVTSNQINDLENKIYTAFFMLYDNDGNRVIFQDLTSTATSGGSISHTVVSDKGLSNATACFLANVSTDYAKSLRTVADLKGAKPLNIEYAPITSECIGIPLLTDASKSLDKVYSIPMAGVKACDLSALTGSSTPIQVPLNRLFAKFIINLSVDLRDDSGKRPVPQKFTLSNFVVNNMPTKVAIMKPDKIEDQEQPTKWSESTIASDYLQQDNVLTYFNLDDGADDSNIITTKNYDGKGQTKSLFFYAPEHIVLPDIENTGVDEAKQYLKPTLFNENSPKKPLYVSIIGDLVDENANDVVAKYDIYLGVNNFDDFTISRNIQYTNNLVIKGTEAADNRVTLSQGFISVSFKRATYLDSHFEVRPLRVKWVGKDENGTPLEPNGTITVQILDAYDDEADAPNWVRLERPSASERSNTNTYCGTIGKRKYFTTDLVGQLRKVEGYQINEDEDGDFPTWVYVDEFTPTGSFSDEVRQAKIRVTFTPDDASEPANKIDYVITQRSIYPVEAARGDDFTYGIEYFEEYLYNYDDPNIQDSNDYTYDTTQDGMEWGLNGIQLSSEVHSVNVDQDKFNQGLKSAGGNIGTLTSYLGDFLDVISTELVNNIIDDTNIGAVYDFYTSLDTQVPDHKRHDYSGLSFTRKIVSDQQIGALSLNNNPSSAVEYCLNKNKRNSDGSITTIHWYLPAIDELEDIVESAYNEFDVFQDHLYWSSQPAYYPNHILYDADIEMQIISSIYMRGYFRFEAGSYYEDNPYSARATKVDSYGNSVSSGANGYYKRLHIKELHDLRYNRNTGITGTLIYDPPVLVDEGYVYQPDLHEWTETEIKWEGWRPTTVTVHKSYPDPAVTVSPYTVEGYDGNCPRTGVKNRVRCVYSKEGIAL